MGKTFSFVSGIGNCLSALLLGNTREMIARIDERTNIMREDIKTIKQDCLNFRDKISSVEIRISSVEMKFGTLIGESVAIAHSPRKLTERGEKILSESGIKEFAEQYLEEIIKEVKSENYQNPYDAELGIFMTIRELIDKYPNSANSLKTGAFKQGVDIDTVAFIGGIYLRDRIFSKLGFSLSDLDKPKPTN